MGYLAAWKVLEEMVTDFRKRGVIAPAKVVNDLKNAKTTIQIFKADPTRGETMQKIEEYLRNVESYLVSEGHKRFGQKYVDDWLKRVDEGTKASDEEERPRFVLGIPRQRNWIRVTPSAKLSLKKLKNLADESGLSHDVQKDGCLLVHGEKRDLKDFVKKMTETCAQKSGE